MTASPVPEVIKDGRRNCAVESGGCCRKQCHRVSEISSLPFTHIGVESVLFEAFHRHTDGKGLLSGFQDED